MRTHINRSKYVVALLVLGVAAAMLVGPALAQDNSAPRTITVNGTGVAQGAPDVGNVQVGVDLANENFTTAYNEASTATSRVISALKESGIAENDIQTSNINVWWEDRYDPQTGLSTGVRLYHVNVTLNVIVRDITKVDSVLSTAVDNGANNIYGLSFGINDNATLIREARSNAVADARANAEHLAELLGVELGAPMSVTEYVGGGSVPLPYTAGGFGGAAEFASSNLPVQPGQLSVTMGVTITYEVK